MKEIILKMDSAQEAVQFTLLLFENGFNPSKATISYDSRRPLPVKIRKLEDYPLVLEGQLNGHPLRVAVTPLEIGCFSNAAYGLRKILKTAQFYIDDRDIFSKHRFHPDGYISLTLTKG